MKKAKSINTAPNCDDYSVSGNVYNEPAIKWATTLLVLALLENRQVEQKF